MSRATMIEVDELRAGLELVLNRVQDRFGPTVDLAADYYWAVEATAAYDAHEAPAGSLVLCQLSDDISSIRDLLARAEEPIIWHDLAHLLGVLQRIAALDLPTR